MMIWLHSFQQLMEGFDKRLIMLGINVINSKDFNYCLTKHTKGVETHSLFNTQYLAIELYIYIYIL